MVRVRVAAFAVLSLAYPLVVYLSLGRFEPRWMALLLFALAALRALTTRQPVWWVAAVGAGLLALLATAFNQALPLKLYPALVNAVMLVIFATSLRFPPSAVERLARLTEPDLPPFAVLYPPRHPGVVRLFRSQRGPGPGHGVLGLESGLGALQRTVGVRDDGCLVRR